MEIRAKDYLVVKEGLYFAVVSDSIESGRALTWLRYMRDRTGMHKLDTQTAAAMISEQYPQYLFHSEVADIDLHGVPQTDIQYVLKPQQAVQHLLALAEPDNKQLDAIKLIKLLADNGIPVKYLGITGSLLLNAHTDQSDIDLLVYDRRHFHETRAILTELVASGELKPLALDDWRDAYVRRDCSFSFEDYLWHEQRKHNKCIVGDSRVDISMILQQDEALALSETAQKLGHETLIAEVLDDNNGFDYPARYSVKHESIDEILVYTATYIGQARAGEMVEASGIVEQIASGMKRLIIGTSREAQGEYLKVIQSEQQKSEEINGT